MPSVNKRAMCSLLEKTEQFFYPPSYQVPAPCLQYCCSFRFPLNDFPTILRITTIVSPDSRFWKAALVLVGEALICYDEQTEMLRSHAVQE